MLTFLNDAAGLISEPLALGKLSVFLFFKTNGGVTTGATPLSITHSPPSPHRMRLDRLQVSSKESGMHLAEF